MFWYLVGNLLIYINKTNIISASKWNPCFGKVLGGWLEWSNTHDMQVTLFHGKQLGTFRV